MRTLRVPKQHIAVIAVNGALDWLPYFDYFFTLDPTRVNRKRLRTHRHNAKYYLAYPKNRILIPSYVVRLDRHSSEASRHAEKDEQGRYTCAIGLNEDPGMINSGNSAFGALGLAYHLGFERVGLIGVDANDKPRVDGGFSRDLSHLPQLFESAMHQIDIINCGEMESSIPQQSIQDFINRLPYVSSKALAHDQSQIVTPLESLQLDALQPPNEIHDSVTDQLSTPTIAPDGRSILLHENVALREESPGTHIQLPFLTTTI